MEKLLLLTLICLQVAMATASTNPRIYKVARGRQVQRHRELQDDPCSEEVSNDRDISNDERARSNVFQRGSNRRLKVAGKASIIGKAENVGKAKTGKATVGKASSSKTAAPTVPDSFGDGSNDFGDGSNDFGAASPTLSPTGVLRTPVSTCIPTLRPVVPTLAPTSKPYTTDPDTALSTCVGDPAEDGLFADELFHFKYNLYVATGANESNAMTLTEMLIHYGLAEEFLTCNFEDDITPDIYAIDSHRNAIMSSEDCDTTHDPIPTVATECVVILSYVNFTAFYPYLAFPYPLPDPAIKNATGFYLNSSMTLGAFVWDDVIQTVFKGWVDDNSTVVAVARGAAADDSGGVILGSALTGIAVLCLLLFLMLAVVRHRNQNDGYKGPGDSLGDTPTFSIGFPNDEFDFGEDDPELRFREQPDVHHCNSAMCLICRGRNGPTFLKTQTQPDGDTRWQQPSTNTRLPERSYDSLDTINI